MNEAELSERRAWIRHPCDKKTSCHPGIGADETRWAARIQNISRGGIKMLAERRFEPRTLLYIEVQTKGKESLPVLLAQVIYVKAQADGQWALGCRFPKELSDKDLETYLRKS